MAAAQHWAPRPLGRGGLVTGPHALGAAPMGNLGRVVPDEEWGGAVPAAWDQGVRYFDVAPHYGLGLAERRLGTALAGRPRGEFIVSTKAGRLLRPATHPTDRDNEGFAVPGDHIRVRDYSRDGILRSLEASLTRLGLDRVDIVFVHDPDDHYRQALNESFPALEELRAQKVIRSYGAGMNQSAMLAEFVRHTDLDVVMLAGRYTLLEQGALDDDLFDLCQERQVSVVAAGVFNSGLLAENRPQAGSTYDYQPAPPHLLARVNRIADVCESHGVPLPAAAAQFPLHHPAVATVCLGARSAAQVTRNAGLFTTGIPGSLWSDLVSAGLLRDAAPVPGHSAAQTGR